MIDLILLRGRGIKGMLGLTEFTEEFPVSQDYADSDRDMLIPPFESEALKTEKKVADSKTNEPLFRFGKAEILLVAGFIAFEFGIFLLCAFFPN